MSSTTTLKHRLDSALTRAPRLYGALLHLRGAPDSDRRIFLEVLRHGDVVFDVGANRGYYTLLFSRLVKDGSVHAFEPVRDTFDALRTEVESRGGARNVVFNNVAVSAAAQSRVIYRPVDDPAQASLERHSRGSWDEQAAIVEEPCDVVTLDDYVTRAGVARLDLLKCDVEGAELPVLQGASQALRRFQPMVHVEVCARWQRAFGYSPVELRATLQDHGYSAFLALSDTGPGRAWEDPFERLASVDVDASANVLCLIPERHFGRLPASLRTAFHRRR